MMLFNRDNGLEKVSEGLETDKKEFFKGVGYSSKKRGSFFTKWYDFYFERIRYEKLNILEIGVAGGDSLAMWKKYFINSNVYGMDINKKRIKESKTKLEGTEVFVGDQSDTVFLKKVCKNISNGFDIVIDDGSHMTGHQIVSFEYLFKKLNSGGIYVIEDVHTSYIKEYKKGSCKSAIDYFKSRVDDVNVGGKVKKYYNKHNILGHKKHKLSYYEKAIESIHFYPDICFILKR